MPPVSPTNSTVPSAPWCGRNAGADRSIGVIAVRIPRPTRQPAPAAPPLHTAPARADLLASFVPLVTLIRWGMVTLGLAFAALDEDDPVRLLAMGAPLVAYAALRTVRPLRYITRGIESLVQVLFEVGLTVAVVVATGYWASPYVFTVATAILAAGFARGFAFALRTAATAIAAVAIPYHVDAANPELIDTLQWATELLLVGVIAGYARRLFGEAEEQTVLARQANDLLAQLHDIAQTLPSSLDLDETAGDAVRELRALTGADGAAVLLRDDAGGGWIVAALEGVRIGPAVDAHLPRGATRAVSESRPTYATAGGFLSPHAVEALYLPLVARSRLVGLVALEAAKKGTIDPARFGEAEAIAHRAALAIDNARWFTLLRRIGADEERTRIARDLHDRVGQSLAFVGFELDRIGRQATGPVEAELSQLREDVRKVVTEVRDTLYDLRTDVTEEQGIGATLSSYLDRIRDRTGMTIDLDVGEETRLPLRQEREIWRIAQEAVTNAARHAGARSLAVRWYCGAARALLEIRDDGRGMPAGEAFRPDAYGVRGMRERAAAIGARLTIGPADEGGTLVRCEVPR